MASSSDRTDLAGLSLQNIIESEDREVSDGDRALWDLRLSPAGVINVPFASGQILVFRDASTAGRY